MHRFFTQLLVSFVLIVAAYAHAAPVNVNTATMEQLVDNLKGIGAHKAQAIIDYREQHGNFHKLDDLLKVKGIGPTTLRENEQDFLFK